MQTRELGMSSTMWLHCLPLGHTALTSVECTLHMRIRSYVLPAECLHGCIRKCLVNNRPADVFFSLPFPLLLIRRPRPFNLLHVLSTSLQVLIGPLPYTPNTCQAMGRGLVSNGPVRQTADGGDRTSQARGPGVTFSRE